MIKKVFILAILALSVSCSNNETSQNINVENLSDVDLTDKVIVIKKDQLGSFQGLETARLAVLEGQEFLPVQQDDIDGDGQWDELAFVVDLDAGKKLGLTLKALKESEELPPFPVRTNVRLANHGNIGQELGEAERLTSADTKMSSKTFQMEGPAWENDLIAFRNYFDARNGMDIFGKRVPDMVLDSVGLPGGDYHTLGNWGMDILKVGNTLGAGAAAVMLNDSLYRLGEGSTGYYKRIAEGPVRTLFAFSWPEWNMNGNSLQAKHIISIEAGKPYYQSSIIITNNKGINPISGIVNMHELQPVYDSLMQYQYIYTHGNQAYDGELLGMAIFASTEMVVDSMILGKNTRIADSYALKFKSLPEIKYYFMADWELGINGVKNAEDFESKLHKQLAQLSARVEVNVSPR